MRKPMIVGVDYGTTTTQISFLTDGGIPDLFQMQQAEGYERYQIRSVLGVDRKRGTVTIGDVARDAEGRVVLPSLKRCLLCSHDKKTGQGTCTNPPNLTQCAGLGRYDVHGTIYKVEELIGLFFKALVRSIGHEGFPTGDIEHADVRVSVPSTYERLPVDRVLGAVRNGLGVSVSREPKREPVSALATLYHEGLLANGIHVVCDIGGGTTDVAMIERNGNRVFLLEPDSVPLGGNDLDDCLFQHVRDKLRKKEFTDPRLLRECRLAKERLTQSERTFVGEKVEITKRQFEYLIAAKVRRIADFVEEYIRGQVRSLGRIATPGGLKVELHLAGGGSRVPLIQRFLRELQFETFQVAVKPVRGSRISEAHEEDFPVFCIALGNVLDFHNFSLSSLPVTIRIMRDRQVEQEIVSHTPFPVNFNVEWSGGLSITACQEPYTFDLMESRQCMPPISSPGHFIGRQLQLGEFLRGKRCSFRFMKGGYFYVETHQGTRRWFEAPWKNTLDEHKKKLALVKQRDELGLGETPP